MFGEAYRFYLGSGEGAKRQVDVVYTNQHERVKGRDQARRQIIRLSIEQAFVLEPGNGYETVLNGGVGSEYFLDIYELDEGVERLYFPGVFSFTDCEIDEDQKTISVKLRVNDVSRKFIDAQDREFNFIPLGAKATPVTYYIYPVLQLYALGSNTVTNVFPGGREEISVEPVTFSNSITFSDLHFGDPQRIAVVPFQPSAPVDVSGIYTTTSLPGTPTPSFTRLDGIYQLLFDSVIPVEEDDVSSATWEIRQVGGSTIYQNTNVSSRIPGFGADGLVLPYVAGPEDFDLIVYAIHVRARFLCFDDSLNGQSTELIPEGDQFAAGTSFTRILPFSDFTIVGSVLTSMFDDGLGRFASGLPFDSSGEFISNYISPGFESLQSPAIAFSQWQSVAWFFNWKQTVIDIFSEGRQEVVLPDAFLIEDVLSVILSEIDPSVTFEGTPEFSQFLFNPTNPVIGLPNVKLLLVPKSNILTFNYTDPATNGKIKLKDFFNTLSQMMQVESFVDDDGKLKVEHISFFESGLSYNNTNSVGLDLNQLIEQFTGEAWSYFTSKYNFDKSDLPERLVFQWMDEIGTDAFRGSDIVFTDNYVDASLQEERRSAIISTDIQSGATRPNSFTPEGFFLIACREGVGGRLEVVDTDVPGFGPLQNGWLSLTFIVEHLFKHNLPSRNYRANREDKVAQTTRRTKKQTVTAPIPSDFNFRSLVRTKVGEGLVDRLSENIESRTAEIILSYGTD